MLWQTLPVALVVPAVLALLVVAAYRIGGLALNFVVFILLFGLVGAGSVTLLVSWLVLLAVVLFAWTCGADPRKSPRWLVGMAVVMCVVSAVVNASRYRDVAELLKEYPIESVRGRLAYEQELQPRPAEPAERTAWPREPVGQQIALPAASDAIEYAVERESWGGSYHRTRALRSLMSAHENFVAEFIAADGFGVGRTRVLPVRKRYIEIPKLETVPLPEPYERETSPSAEEEPRPFQVLADANLAGGPAYDSLEMLHVEGVVDFVNPRGFGYAEQKWIDNRLVVNADRVIGFQPHAFRAVPAMPPSELSSARWSVENLDLVSLLKHDPPAAYVSQNLPKMDELREAPTRTLDGFEQEALPRLHGGEDLVVGTRPNEIRMLGAIRAVQQCLECHQVGRGTLLGAFSYRLRRSPEMNEPVPRPVGEGPLSLNDRHAGVTYVARIAP